MSIANLEIRVLMLKCALTQQDLAEILGMSQPEVSHMLKREMSQAEKKRIKGAMLKALESRGGGKNEKIIN